MLRAKLEKQSCLGIFSKTTDSAFVEAAGLAGLDFIILDTEHGPAGWETLHNHVRAAKLTPMMPIIRVKGVDAHTIGAALDTGAAGVQVPNINTPQQARDAVHAARFHPQGRRGVCRFVRAAGFGSQPRDQYFQHANQQLLVLQVEGIEGVNNLGDILDVPGFDVLFIGPYDLSQSVGVPGQIDAPEVNNLIKIIAEKAHKKHVLLGSFCEDTVTANSLTRDGFRFLAYSVDISIFQTAVKSLLL